VILELTDVSDLRQPVDRSRTGRPNRPNCVTGRISISVNQSRAQYVAAINLTQHERNQALLLVLLQRLADRLSSKGVMVLLESRQRPPFETQYLCGLDTKDIPMASASQLADSVYARVTMLRSP
jgi:hypothetical protein